MGIFNSGDTSDCVSCSVQTCKHHSVANCCTASHINVVGKNAVSERDTICGTYCKKDSESMC
ncbi:MAG: DUF1540 domain-containing protein [Clostridia bacterium]